jgi:hypothetical protein
MGVCAYACKMALSNSCLLPGRCPDSFGLGYGWFFIVAPPVSYSGGTSRSTTSA